MILIVTLDNHNMKTMAADSTNKHNLKKASEHLSTLFQGDKNTSWGENFSFIWHCA